MGASKHTSIKASGAPSAANILRNMRQALGISQLELALRLGMSQRHIGFVELGRSRPSVGLILNWTRETGGSIDERNAALVSAGYSPAFLEEVNADQKESLAFRALGKMLLVHEPNPGIIFDADWMVRAVSEGAQWLCSVAMPGFLEQGDSSTNRADMIAAVTHPEGLLSKVINAAETGHALLKQMRTEELTRSSLKPRVDLFEASLEQRFGAWNKSAREPGDTHLQIVLDTENGPMKFLLMQTVFGLPHNVTQASLRSELWFPADDATRIWMATRGRTREKITHPPTVPVAQYKASAM